MTNRVLLIAVVAVLSLSALPAYADETVVGGGVTPSTSMRARDSVSRPALLPVLYASYAGLQAYDIYSTRQAVSRGARESNPMMQSAAGSTPGKVALKAGVTVGTIVAAERMWKSNKVGAIAVLVASNSVAAIVAARNSRVLHDLR